MFNHFRLY